MLLFDLDGTLIDSNAIWVEVDLAFLSQHGLAPTEEYVYTMGHSIFPLAAQYTKDYYHLDLTPQSIMETWLSMARVAYAQVPLKEGAAAYLDQCRGAGERLALVTACVPELCQLALDRHHLSEYFETTIYAQELGMEKRDPQFFALAARQLAAAPEDCVLYDDAPANCAAAQQAGMQVVGVYDSFYAAYQHEVQASSNQYITSLTQLLV